MTPQPAVTTYFRITGPAKSLWLARFGDLPLVFTGQTEADVIQAAEDWWRAAQAKEAALQAKKIRACRQIARRIEA